MPALIQEYSEKSLLSNTRIDPDHFDINVYELIEKKNRLRVYGVFKDDVLSGFLVLVAEFVPHMQYDVAYVESLFVKNGADPRLGTLLIQTIKQAAKEWDCKAVVVTAPTGSKLDKFFSKHYKPMNTLYFDEV